MTSGVYVRTKEIRESLSNARKEEYRKGLRKPWNKGKKGLQVAWNKGLKGEEYKKHYPQGFFKKHSSEIITKLNKKYPNMAKEAGKKGGSKSSGKGCGKGIYPRTKKHIDICRLGGYATVLSGQLFEASKKIHCVPHDDHSHRSKGELKTCEQLQKIYGKNKVHTNVHMKLVEIDFVITNNIKDINAWEKVIEYHPYSFYEKNPKNYERIRKKTLRKLGVKCPIEVLI